MTASGKTLDWTRDPREMYAFRVDVPAGAQSLEVAFDHDPARLSGAGTVALEHDGALWIGTFAGDRILRVAEAR